MITISTVVEKIIQESLYFQKGLSEGLINISALARKIKPEIEKELQKEIKEGAIVMAIKRFTPILSERFNEDKLFEYFRRTGDIIIRSDLVDFAFKNSSTLIQKQSVLLRSIQSTQDIFHASSKGIYESNIIISRSYQETIMDLFEEENLITKIDNLASVTLRSPESTTEDVSGIFFYITKMFHWHQVNIVEIISTKHEMTFIVNKKDINISFILLQNLKEK